MSEEE